MIFELFYLKRKLLFMREQSKFNSEYYGIYEAQRDMFSIEIVKLVYQLNAYKYHTVT